MRFNETLLYRTIRIPVDGWGKNCAYYWFLALPYYLLLVSVGIPVALIFDVFMAIRKAH